MSQCLEDVSTLTVHLQLCRPRLPLQSHASKKSQPRHTAARRIASWILLHVVMRLMSMQPSSANAVVMFVFMFAAHCLRGGLGCRMRHDDVVIIAPEP